jgi:hypothetical protein
MTVFVHWIAVPLTPSVNYFKQPQAGGRCFVIGRSPHEKLRAKLGDCARTPFVSLMHPFYRLVFDTKFAQRIRDRSSEMV